MCGALMTCIVLKSNVTVMDIVSTSMLGQFGFLVRNHSRWLICHHGVILPFCAQIYLKEGIQLITERYREKVDYNNFYSWTLAMSARSKNRNLLNLILGDVSHGSAICALVARFWIRTLYTLLRIAQSWYSRVGASQAQTFSIFQRNEVSVDVVATSEVSISLTLDPSKIWGRDLVSEELEVLKVLGLDPRP